jgi:hypothetical protein
VLLICAGSVAILLPAWLPVWLPDRSPVPVARGTVELLQAILLAASAAVMLGASPHAGEYRPVCRLLALLFLAAFLGELGDFTLALLGSGFSTVWVIGGLLLVALATALRHRRVMRQFLAHLGYHAGSGWIGAGLLILYVFNRVIGSATFWKVSLGAPFSQDIPKICQSYLELLACYFLFIGVLGLSITLARRHEPT